MRRFYLLTLAAILIQACALVEPPAPIVPTTTLTFTPTETPTVTVTSTITPSPTIVHIPTFDPFQPTPTGIPLPIYQGKSTPTPYTFLSPTPSGPGPGFVDVKISEKNIHWGSCKPNSTKIITKVQNPEDVYSVVIFVQVKSAVKEDYTPWTNGDVMQRNRDETFSYVLAANTTRGHNHYKRSYIYFQLVATDWDGEEIGRTKIYKDEIALTPCS